jgi:hypothetical protein
LAPAISHFFLSSSTALRLMLTLWLQPPKTHLFLRFSPLCSHNIGLFIPMGTHLKTKDRHHKLMLRDNTLLRYHLAIQACLATIIITKWDSFFLKEVLAKSYCKVQDFLSLLISIRYLKPPQTASKPALVISTCPLRSLPIKSFSLSITLTV